jgi:pSer/pThr/pTyr-binding forkhead associated (FHA) protein
LGAVALLVKVRKGAEVGKEFVFEKDEVRFGRTADNDVVVKDSAASRSHARVLVKGSGYQVEDLGSANGTKLNGAPISGTRNLKTKDSIEIGDTVYVFEFEEARAEQPQATLNDEDPDDAVATGDDEPNVDINSTVIRPPKRPSRIEPLARRPSASAAPADSLDEEAGGEVLDKETGRYMVSAQNRQVSKLPPRSGASRLAAQSESAPSAAERYREKRQLEQSASGKLVLWWRSLGRPMQFIVGTFGGTLLLAVLGLTVKLIVPAPTGPQRIEPEALTVNAEALGDHFGVGDAVDFVKVDQKAFNFELASATRMVGVLHFHSAKLLQDEVSVTFNGNDMGFAPGDVNDNDNRETDIVLPVGMMKPQATNVIVFDNVKNPPAKDPWEIWDVWVEAIPVPELSAEETTARAKELTDTAAKLYETRGLGAANMFRAWKAYREAWLLLESAPERPEALLSVAKTRMREIRPELDLLCQKITVKVRQSIQLGRDKDAVSELKNVPSYFPTREHPCHMKSKRALLSVADDLREQENQ